MAGVKLGAPSQTVLARLGDPVRIGDDSQPGLAYEHWFYRGLKVDLIGSGRLFVLNMETSSPDAVTPRGVGVGSGQNGVREAYPSARCRTVRGVRTCTIGQPGSRQTGFRIRQGIVRSIYIGDVF
jgi:hypothetical protein